ncbi:FAD-binding oxidoreductase [Rhizobium sp. L1K21]|uniref:NAD(P)/FAD-dependent oxidoreductase n=1 Tax=Rhizobium sp. L1K21 TaxID=2954933 RepID=UPI00211B26FD|nr:FAD-binding oxidoreductase [Rhizobium sp. L1K21]
MVNVDRAAAGQGQSGGRACDILVIGGGIMGLWATLKAADAGAAVCLVDAGALGHGASYGHLGALMAHKPDGWNAKKQFQFDALLELEGALQTLEARTGLTSGYRRSGRLIPMAKPHHREVALRHEAEARENWRPGGQQFEWRVTDTPPVDGWPDAGGFQSGYVLDTFAARAAPRALTSLLIAALRNSPSVHIHEGAVVSSLSADQRSAVLADGARIHFNHCIVAAGNGSFPLLEALSPIGPRPLGKSVKGQSALLAADVDPALPLIFLNGLYVIPHEGGQVAIGSTSETEFDDPYSTDGQLEDLIAKARALVPALENAPVLERWAGLRPKAVGRDPMAGPHPEHGHIHALTGGFKVSFGIAHRLADCVLGPILGQPHPALPQTFRLEAHLG